MCCEHKIARNCKNKFNLKRKENEKIFEELEKKTNLKNCAKNATLITLMFEKFELFEAKS